MEQALTGVGCTIIIDSGNNFWRTDITFPTEIAEMKVCMETLRNKIHAAANLFPEPQNVIQCLILLQPSFASPPQGSDPIIKAAQAGDTVVQIELTPPHYKQSREITIAAQNVEPAQLDLTDQRITLDGSVSIVKGVDTLFTESMSGVGVVTLFARWMKMIYATAPAELIEDNVVTLVVDPLDILMAVEAGTDPGGSFYRRIDDYVFSFTAEIKSEGVTTTTSDEPIVATEQKYLH